MINEFPAPNLPPNHTLWFKEYGATSHTAVFCMATVRRSFPQRVISRFGDVSWPPRSPDLTASDFFLWFYLKSKVYSTRPTDVGALKQKIREEIANISEETLREAMHSFSTRVRLCIQEVGSHIKYIVHKVKQCKNKLCKIVKCKVLKLI
jgi:hypothetical protein